MVFSMDAKVGIATIVTCAEVFRTIVRPAPPPKAVIGVPAMAPAKIQICITKSSIALFLVARVLMIIEPPLVQSRGNFLGTCV